jgi:MOSC domain-containing protein YiiM
MIDSRLDALFIGKPLPFRSDGMTSSIGARLPANGPVRLTFLGFEGDRVADPEVHGGPDKAVHFYPAEHYPVWRAFFEMKGWAPHPLLDDVGSFGENLSGNGLTEAMSGLETVSGSVLLWWRFHKAGNRAGRLTTGLVCTG